MSAKVAKPFRFKQFSIAQDRCSMKIGTDGVLLGAWTNAANAKSILDIGTGTGLIAIMLAQQNEYAIVEGIEIDPNAYEQAAENMAASPFSIRLHAINKAIQDFVPCSLYDVIVSNPPFFNAGTYSNQQKRNAARHTVSLTHTDLSNAVKRLLADEGRFSVILPYLEGLKFIELAKEYGLFLTRKTQVKPKANKKVERLLLEFKKREQEIVLTDTLVIQFEKRNDWTKEYKALTGAFYLKI